MRLIITGSRSIYGPNGVKEVKEAIRQSGWRPNEIISGHKGGVDRIGEEIAKENGINLAIFPANTKKYGKSAFFKQNAKLTWYASMFNEERGDKCPDNLKGAIIVVWNGRCKTTEHLIKIAGEHKVPTHIHIVDK